MAIRDYWVYQKRENPEGPWVLYIVKEFDKGNPGDERLDVTYYSEQIPNRDHQISELGKPLGNLGAFVAQIETRLQEFTTVYAQDHEQLVREISWILNN